MFYTRLFLLGFVAVMLLSFGLSYFQATQSGVALKNVHWSDARRDATGLAPDPVKWKETAVVQVYAAPTFGWRGLLAVHPWIIFKRAGETRYHRFDVISWGSQQKVRQNYALPDGYWFGAKPDVLVDHRGDRASALIPQIEAAIRAYPYPESYRAWPGPNSNTFMAHIGREVPDLKLDLPANAIGKDFRPLSHPVGLSSSGRGVQISLYGVLGMNLGREGVEVNLLGFNMGVDLLDPALRLPFVGRLGESKVARDATP